MSSIEPVRHPVLNMCLKSSVLIIQMSTMTDLPENSAPMMNSQTNHEQSWFKSLALPMLDPDKVNNTDVNADVNTDLRGIQLQ